MSRIIIRLACLLLFLAVLFLAGRVALYYVRESADRALKDEDYAAAFKVYRVLGNLGDTSSQHTLGALYAFGSGVQKDDAKAIYWFRRAAGRAQGGADPAAPAELGVSKCYAEGIGGAQKDAAESLKWLRCAAAGGSKEARARLQGARPE